MFQKVPSADPAEQQRWRERIEAAQRRFAALSEEDQMISILAGRIGPARELSKSMEDMLKNARSIIENTHGPKYAERILADPEILKRLHLDTFTPPPESMTTVVQGR